MKHNVLISRPIFHFFKLIFFISLIAFLYIQPSPIMASGGKIYIPSSVPVNIKPSHLGERLIGLGFNRMAVTFNWKDNFFDRRAEGGGQWEDVGDLETTATNGAIGYIYDRSDRYSEEWDFIAGALSIKSKTNSYTSPFLGKVLNVDLSGSGFDIGGRYLGGYSLAKTELGTGRALDWNLAFSLHSIFFYLNNSEKAESVDGLDINHEDMTDYGLFLRPSVAFQPIIPLGTWISIVPYAGISSMLLVGVEDWKDTILKRDGADRKLGSDTDWIASGTFETVFGFDIGLISPFSREHQCTVGGALTQLYGGTSGNFYEFHLLYSIPIGRNKSSK
ncbi:MAG: hypothetical protein LHV69_08035 [Elusimicrobia bacterium]|nr:hypothetical protein [Candidatus Obscuribacterium magneticum]